MGVKREGKVSEWMRWALFLSFFLSFFFLVFWLLPHRQHGSVHGSGGTTHRRMHEQKLSFGGWAAQRECSLPAGSAAAAAAATTTPSSVGLLIAPLSVGRHIEERVHVL